MLKKRRYNIKNVFLIVFSFTILYFFCTTNVSAKTCYSCDDLGPDPKCAAGGSCCTHKVAPDQEDFDCGGDRWMGYTERGIKYCCTGYYGYECGEDGEPTNPCDPCTPVCKAPLTGTDKQNIYKVPNAFSCTDSEPAGCTGAQTRYIDCYEVPSPQPVPALFIHPEKYETSLGFTSNTHTGGGSYSTTKDDTVNDFMPYSASRYSLDDNTFYMQATFTDTDQKIEMMYVWFSQSDTAPITPKTIDLDNNIIPGSYGTNSKKDFGFALNYKDSQWTPYVPAISGAGNEATDWWKKASSYKTVDTVDGKTVFSLPGKNGNVIANIVIYSINVENDGKKVTLKFGVSFKDKVSPYNLLANHANEGKYNIWLMANDKFGFTPYDNYVNPPDPKSVVNAIHKKWVTKERIRFYDQWKDSGLDWKLNFDNPGILLTFEPAGKTTLKVSWDFYPDLDYPNEFNKLVFNIYKNQELYIQPIGISNFVLNGGTLDSRENPFTVKTISDSGDILGHINYTKNRYVFSVSGGSGDGSVILDLHDAGAGFLDFYITAFDEGGNLASSGSSQFDLRDWMTTEGGLLYSQAIGFSVPDFTSEPVGWTSKGVLPSYLHADLSTELIGIKSAGILSAPIQSPDTKGYMIRPYTAKNVDGYYSTLKGLFDRRKSSISNLTEIKTSVLSGSLSGAFGLSSSSIGYVVTSSLTVNNYFLCDGKAVLFVSGDLTLNGNIRNSNTDKDACIFVVGGQVTINEGGKSSVGSMQYDKINGYILADGAVNIVKEAYTAPSILDGLYVNGGIHSLSSDGVQMKRALTLEDKLRYPVFVVKNHSKYGVLARTLFGGSLVVQKTEVGIKPY